jgi:6-phosphogluconolactonase (cycloisomerase 2 family)
VSQSGQQVIYFTGKDPGSGQPAVLTLPTGGASTPTIVVKGTPLVVPDGVTVTRSGILYVTDRQATGGGEGKVFKIDRGTVSTLIEQVKLGNPAGIALSANESLLLVSAYQKNSSYDQVLVIELATQRTGSVTRVVGQNTSAGGLHASPGKEGVFSWADYTAGIRGTVFAVRL